ncbi:hypothetical protein F4703DRAFT_1093736 [Phycomyces blakesleeanus]
MPGLLLSNEPPKKFWKSFSTNKQIPTANDKHKSNKTSSSLKNLFSRRSQSPSIAHPPTQYQQQQQQTQQTKQTQQQQQQPQPQPQPQQPSLPPSSQPRNVNKKASILSFINRSTPLPSQHEPTLPSKNASIFSSLKKVSRFRPKTALGQQQPQPQPHTPPSCTLPHLPKTDSYISKPASTLPAIPLPEIVSPAGTSLMDLPALDRMDFSIESWQTSLIRAINASTGHQDDYDYSNPPTPQTQTQTQTQVPHLPATRPYTATPTSSVSTASGPRKRRAHNPPTVSPQEYNPDYSFKSGFNSVSTFPPVPAPAPSSTYAFNSDFGSGSGPGPGTGPGTGPGSGSIYKPDSGKTSPIVFTKQLVPVKDKSQEGSSLLSAQLRSAQAQSGGGIGLRMTTKAKLEAAAARRKMIKSNYMQEQADAALWETIQLKNGHGDWKLAGTILSDHNRQQHQPFKREHFWGIAGPIHNESNHSTNDIPIW